MKEHKLIKLLDQVKPDLFPLNTHYMAQFSEHEKQQYATMLAAFIAGSGFVSDAQARLFSMLCVSLGLGKEISQYYQQANDMNVVFLADYIDSVKIDKNKSSAFLIDIIVLDLLGESKNARVINELYSLLDLDLQGVFLCIDVILGNKISDSYSKSQKLISIDDLSEQIVGNKRLREIKEYCNDKKIKVESFLRNRENKLKVDNYSWSGNFDQTYHKVTSSNVSFKFTHTASHSGIWGGLSLPLRFNDKKFQCALPIYIRMPDYFSAWTSFTNR